MKITRLIFNIISSIVLTIFCITHLITQTKPQIINTYDSELVEMSISYKDDVYTIDIEKYNKHFTVSEKDTKLIVYYEDKAVVEEYDNGSIKLYFYIGID